MDGVALFDDIEHAQRVDRHDLNAAVGLLVEGRGQICGDRGHIQLALDELGHDLIGRTVELEVVVKGGRALLFHFQQVDQTHGGGAFQTRDADSGGGRLGRCAAGQYAQQQCRRQQQRKQFFLH